MSTLVYTTAFGESHFYELAEQMFLSLRRRGYQGAAALLCDRKPDFADKSNVDAIVLDEIHQYPLLKARLPQFRDISGYDRVLFVDTDVVFLREPSPLFALDPERLLLSRDHYPLQRNSFNLSFLSPTTRRNPALKTVRSINTGVVMTPGARHAEYMARWLEAWASPAVAGKLKNRPMKFSELRDQPVMQKLVTEDGLDCDYIPDSLLLMPLFFTETQPLHPDTVLLHLNGSSRTAQQKRWLVETMARLNGLDSHEDFKSVCKELRQGLRVPSFPLAP